MKDKSVNLCIPEDILFEIDSFYTKGQSLEDKLKLNLAIGLFVSKNISLGKAAQISGKPLAEFISVLNSLDIPTVEYTLEAHEDDDDFMSQYKSEKDKL
jgi:predicted HTH domain antitoxin